MKIRSYIFGLTAIAMMAWGSGCAESEAIVECIAGDNSDIIHIGGIDRDVASTSLAGYTTRAAGDNESVDAETVDWLLGPLFGGLDITYGRKKVNPGDDTHEKVAILKLLKNNPSSPDISSSNIKYSQYTGPNGEKIAEYSFKYRTGTETEGDDAIWYDNGAHYFQGVFVPEKLRYMTGSSAEIVNGPSSLKAPNLKIDQSKEGDTDNYTLLARYLGMPADATIHATVGRVKLPFRHRLARVIAYVLIDPTMGDDVTIQGYNVDGRDDAATSEIKFCNVDVLAGVEERDDDTGHATLTPRWDTSRKVIPHFVEESGSKNSLGNVVNATNFIMFYNTEEKEYIFPTDDEDWIAANTRWNDAYTTALNNYQNDDPRRESKAAEDADKNSKLKRTKYGKVPVYDLIVRPTYKTEDMVMYDEDLTGTSKAELVTKTNNIDFEITLSNGLEYTKEFKFDLDANYQTIVYLRITRELIDYNSSGADTWKEDSNSDGYYGVNNQNGNTLSFAGSSWQRAYRIGSTNPNVTDGHYYGQDDTTDDDNVQDDDNMPWYPQYVSQAKWIEMFAEAYMDPATGNKGLHHGDYFILDSDITIDAKALPADFVFTGHLDGQDHSITLTGMGQKVVDQPAWDEDYYVLATEDDYSATLYVEENGSYAVYTMPSLYIKVHHDAVAATYYESYSDYNEGHKDDAGFTALTEDQFKELGKEATIKTPAVEAYDEYVLADLQPSIAQMLAGEFYIKVDENTYSPHNPTLYANHIIHHDEVWHSAGSTLFAGLNGAYSAAIGEANVHSEKQNGQTILVPYVDDVSKTGWRAEVINTRITGADMFPVDAIKADGNYDVDKVSGYIYNCWKGTEKIKSHTPTLPKYKQEE